MSNRNVEPGLPGKPVKRPRPVRVRRPRKPFNIKQWGREMRSELKKVVWPTPKQVLNNSTIVAVSVVLVGGIVAIFDFGAYQLFGLLVAKTVGQ